MPEKKENLDNNASKNHESKNLKRGNCTKDNKKRGWSHIIDEVRYSSGPGDNIYVFG
jgi:hypothetical protein